MHKFYLLITISCIFLLTSCSEYIPDYNDSNGTIIFTKNSLAINETLRKCNLKSPVADFGNFDIGIVYDNYNNKSVIGHLKDFEEIQIHSIYTKVYKYKQKNKIGFRPGEIWYQISTKSINGWIWLNSDYLFIDPHSDPYYNNRYQIIGKYQGYGKEWTIRTMDQGLAAWGNLVIRDNPGNNSKVIFETNLPSIQKNPSYIEVIAITEENETIDNKTDYWLKIKFDKHIGWIFGSTTTAERGGPKYFIPEDIISCSLQW